MDQRELSLAVVGIDFDNPGKDAVGRRFEIAMCSPGEPVELRPEPTNKHDPRAVAVYSFRGIQIGYLTAERCGWIGAKIRNGEDVVAIFQEVASSAAIIRVRFDGQQPTLPPPRAPEDDGIDHDMVDDDFEPDPEGPDWGA